MSTSYFIHCVTCRTTLEYEVSRFEMPLLRTLIRHRAAIAALAPLLEEAQGDIHLGDDRRGIRVSWFAEHQTHELVVMDEDDRIDGRCGDRYACHRCACRRFCNLPIGHDGEHQGHL